MADKSNFNNADKKKILTSSVLDYMSGNFSITNGIFTSEAINNKVMYF